MKNTDPEMNAKLKSRTHLRNMFLNLLSRFLRGWLQSSKIANMTFTIFFLHKRYQKTQNFTLISNPLKKVFKKYTRKKL
jgi:hypothetical protein